MQLYSLVTPARDEARTIGQTIASVASQTVVPQEWIIVSDGSTDATDQIVLEAAKQFPWIRLISLPPRTGRSFAAVVHNTMLGVSKLERAYDFLGLLDADVTFQNDYFERLIGEFGANPKLGLAGGVAIDVGLPRNVFPKNRLDVPGAVQFYRRQCFEVMGGLIPIPEGGWDGMACATARMKGYETKLITSLVVDHHKPRNISEGGILRRKWQMGVRDYAAGYHPVFEVFKCASRFITERPMFIAGAAWSIGYAAALISKRKRVLPPDLLAFVQAEQLSRVKGTIIPFRSLKVPKGGRNTSAAAVAVGELPE